MAENLKSNFSSSSKSSVNVLIACTGSVASIKIPELVKRTQELEIPMGIKDKNPKKTIDINVRLVTTEHAKHFFDYKNLSVVSYEDKDEWDMWKERTDPVLHIELRRWADIMVIAPLDANTLAKLASGISDNLLTCVVRAWDMNKSLYFAPAMNTHMWYHPLTSTHIDSLLELGYREIKCIAKTLVCGDKGLGAMAEVDTIVKTLFDAIYDCKVKI